MTKPTDEDKIEAALIATSNVVDRMNELLELEAGWNNGFGDPMDLTSIERCTETLLLTRGGDRFGIFPNLDGTVRAMSSHIDATFEKDGTVNIVYINSFWDGGLFDVTVRADQSVFDVVDVLEDMLL